MSALSQFYQADPPGFFAYVGSVVTATVATVMFIHRGTVGRLKGRSELAEAEAKISRQEASAAHAESAVSKSTLSQKDVEINLIRTSHANEVKQLENEKKLLELQTANQLTQQQIDIANKLETITSQYRLQLELKDNEIETLTANKKRIDRMLLVDGTPTGHPTIDLNNIAALENRPFDLEGRRYIEEDHCLTLDDSRWEHQRMTISELYPDWYREDVGRSGRLYSEFQNIPQVIKNKHLHLFRLAPALHPGFSLEGSVAFKRIYPCVTVQCFGGREDATKFFFNFLKWVCLVDHLDRDTRFETERIQHNGKILYMRGYFTLSNVRINGNSESKNFFILREFILINAGRRYAITTCIPNFSRAEQETVFSEVGNWLSCFRPAAD
jgi:hypothetical protein